MNALTTDPSAEHIYRALASPCGIAIRVSYTRLALSRLMYLAKLAREAGDVESRTELRMRVSPASEDEIWIIRTATPGQSTPPARGVPAAGDAPHA